MAMANDSAGIGASGPVPTGDLARRIARAELIVAATVTEVSAADGPVTLVSPEARPDADRLYRAEVAVARMLAGETDGGPLRVFFLVGVMPSRPWVAYYEGQMVLLFLWPVPGGYAPVEPTELPIATRPSLAPPPPGLSPTRAVAHELDQIILTADTATEMGLLAQATAARVSLSGTTELPGIAPTALDDLGRRAAWAAVALADGKIDALVEVQRLAAASPPLPDSALWHLVVQQVGALRTPEARPKLAALLTTPVTELARAAAVALREMGDRAALPDLVAALDHPDQMVRYQAVMALAEMEPDVDAGPALDEYRADEARYLARWRRWWQDTESETK